VTNSGVIWKVIGASPRVSFVSDAQPPSIIPSADVSAAGEISRPGVINLAENYDSHWQTLLNGRRIPVKRGANGLPAFNVSEDLLKGNKVNQITILHASQIRRVALSMQVLAFLIVLILALPAGRKRGSIT
jgi:hypothetical protein